MIKEGWTVPWALVKYGDNFFIKIGFTVNLENESRGTAMVQVDLKTGTVKVHPEKLAEIQVLNQSDFEFTKNDLIQVTLVPSESMPSNHSRRLEQTLQLSDLIGKYSPRLADYILKVNNLPSNLKE